MVGDDRRHALIAEQLAAQARDARVGVKQQLRRGAAQCEDQLRLDQLDLPDEMRAALRDLEQLGVVVGRNGLSVFVSEEKPSIARARRRKSTLAAFRQALHEALRAGHGAEVLADLVEALAAQEPVEGGKKAATRQDVKS